MTSLISRDTRTETNLQIDVWVQDISSERLITPMITGRLKTISTSGACISLPQIIIDNTHLFFATLNNQDNRLLVRISLPEGDEDLSKIVAKPIWMNTWRVDRVTEFRIGLKFFSKQPELYTIIKKLS